MDRNQAIAKLIAYALEKQLIQPEEKNWAVNTLLEMLELDGCALPEIPVWGTDRPAGGAGRLAGRRL